MRRPLMIKVGTSVFPQSGHSNALNVACRPIVNPPDTLLPPEIHTVVTYCPLHRRLRRRYRWHLVKLHDGQGG